MRNKIMFITAFLLAITFLASCNVDSDPGEIKDAEEQQQREGGVDQTIDMDKKMDKQPIDRVDEDSLGEDGIQGNHPFDINEEGKLNIQK